MHEASIMADALELAAREAAKAGAHRVRRLRLRIGILSGVVPEALRFAFDSLTPDTPAANGLLEIESVDAVAWCAICQNEFAAGDGFNPCPVCGALPAELRRGQEIELASLEVE